jgi:CHAD domain-containing protein
LAVVVTEYTHHKGGIELSGVPAISRYLLNKKVWRSRDFRRKATPTTAQMRIEYILPQDMHFDDLQSILQKNTRLLTDPQRTVDRTYYDSFDWRLYQNDSLLEDTRDGNTHTLVWRTLKGKNVCPRLKLNETPRFARNLPPGSFRNLLEPVLEMRELIPKIRVRSRIRSLRILNKDRKTVACLAVEINTLPVQKGARPGKLDNRAVVIPVKGYQRSCNQLVKLLNDLGLAPAQDDLMLAALSVSGKIPGEYSSRLALKLDPAMRADQAGKLIMHRLLDIMLQNEAGTRAGTDTEFLHDFRVGIRRTRSALTQIRMVFPKRIVDRYKTEFAWLGSKTSPIRDLDVYLLNFDKYRDRLPAEMQDNIEPLHEFLIRHLKLEHRTLIKTLDSARYRRLIANWRNFLEQPVNERTTLKNAGRPVLDVACERIWSVYRRAIREGNVITAKSPAAELHELRKTCKKLRYLMEFFQSLYPAGNIRKLIRALKTLQDNLGDFQDYEVQVTTLKKFSHQMVAEGMAPPDTLLAMGMLIDGLERRQQQAREEFSDRYAVFSQQDIQDRYRKLFASSQQPGEPPA